MVTVVIVAFNHDAVAIHIQAGSVGNVGDAQVLSHFRANLRSIAIDSLTAADDQIVIDLGDGTGNGRRSCPSISATERTVRNQVRIIGAHGQSFMQNGFRLRGSHGYDINVRIRCFIFNG